MVKTLGCEQLGTPEKTGRDIVKGTALIAGLAVLSLSRPKKD